MPRPADPHQRLEQAIRDLAAAIVDLAAAEADARASTSPPAAVPAHGDPDEVLFTDEVADLTRTSASTLAYYRTVGLGPAWFKRGRRAMYLRSDVEAWMVSLREKSLALQDHKRRQLMR